MRFREHYGIAKTVACGNYTVPYLLGSLCPDYFERYVPHRPYESLRLIKRRIHKVMNMKPGFWREYLLGTIMHYLCDYCCYSHSDKYHEFVHHCKYEIKSQKYYRKELVRPYMERARIYYAKYKDDKTAISSILMRHARHVESLHSPKWWTDEKIMELDLQHAYCVCYLMYHRAKLC